MKKRCDWANASKLEIDYHDNEWGVEVHDDEKLFEILLLESMQAGLSWATILAKRKTIKTAYDDFDFKLIANYDDKKIAALLLDEGIIRNKLKINAAVTNAKAFMQIQAAYSSFANYIWGFVDNKPIINNWESIKDVPASTPLSNKISQELKKKGFKFLGPTSVYAFMQSAGMVNDHLNYCFKK